MLKFGAQLYLILKYKKQKKKSSTIHKCKNKKYLVKSTFLSKQEQIGQKRIKRFDFLGLFQVFYSGRKQCKKKESCLFTVFHRPGAAGAVLETPP